MLRWSVAELARRAGVSPTTVNRFEREITVPIGLTMKALRQALEEGGVEFLNGDEPGVRLRKRRPPG
jgi:transcriptional regulator with XRE-family HTH domain